MKFVVFAVLFIGCAAVIKAQSCLTQEDVRHMLAQSASSTPPAPNKKLKEELLKMATKQREALIQVVERDQKDQSDKDKLHKLYEENTAKLCELIKTNGWPTTPLVDAEGVFAAFHILKNAATYELQRDLLPVIVAVIQKDPIQKKEFAGLYDRLRVGAGMKQLFGTQAVSMGGFLVLYPVEDPAKLDARRAEFGLGPIDLYIKSLEQT